MVKLISRLLFGFFQHLSQISQHSAGSLANSFGAVNLSASHPNLTTIGSMNREDNVGNNR